MYPLRRYIFRMFTVFGTSTLVLFAIHSLLSSNDSVTLETLLSETRVPTLSSTNSYSTTPSPINNTTITRSHVRHSNIPDIFDLSLWRHALVGNRGNQTLCPVPSEYLPIANAYCHAQGRDDCPEIPCTLIYISDEFTQSVECLRGGRVAVGVKPDWICRKSAALEIFSNTDKKPSIQAEAYTPLTSELFDRALGPYRDETSKWGLTLEGESIGYYPSVVFKTRLLPLFDITIGYDRRIFDLITDLYLLDYADLIANRLNRRLTMRQVLTNKVKGRAPILWINSNCDTPSNRTGYMLELMRYVSVDVRGKCGNPNWNETVNNQSDIDPNLFAKEKLLLAGEYLFTVAIENTFEYDYVTEKLWQPLAAGSVPLYLGAPNIDDWLPCTNYSCIINLRQFKSPQEVATLVNTLVKYRGLYMRYHQWRVDRFMRPSFFKMIDYFQEADKYSIECLLCDMVYRHDRGTTRRKLLAANNPFNDTFPSLE